MEKHNNNKIKLGIFVTVGVALLIIAVYFIGNQQQLFSNTFRVSGIFKDISGLEVGNNVRFAGITVGVVEDIEIIADTAVRVDFIIDKKAKKFIKKDARASIGSDGLMGNKILIIAPGTSGSKEIEDNDIIATSVPVSMDEILTKLKTSTSNAADITEDLAVIMDNIRSGKGTIGKLFMDTVFAQNIDQSVINIKQGTGGFKKNMDAASHNILLRGYLKRKERQKEKKQEEKEERIEKEKKEAKKD
jgi:phospholipid/cholesterol/gamma-HCH transport system substrate-binding protein